MPKVTSTHIAPADTVADTAAVDTSQLYHSPTFTDSFPTLTSADSTALPLDQTAVMTIPADVQPLDRGHSLVHDTGAMSLLLASLFFLVVSYRNGYKYIENLLHNMFSVRRRENLFEDYTVKETQILSALIGLTCVTEAIMMYQGVRHFHPSLLGSLQQFTTLHIVAFFGVALGFYFLQMLVFNLLGYIFSDHASTKVWLDGFKATQALLGLLLFPLVAVSLTQPQYTEKLLISAFILYFCLRFVFICKGFRIFYSNLLSLVYFILYLCAVEIVPLVLTYGATIALCNSI